MNLQVLMNGAFGRNVPAEFAAADYDYEAALRDELRKLMCDAKGNFNRYTFERNKYDIFEALSQNLDEILPQSVSAALNMFADVIRLPQGSHPEFIVTKGKQRGKRFVTRATESGNYETFRLDRERIAVYPQTIGGAGYVDFERYLDGVESIADIYEVITEGMLDRIFELVQEVLLQTWKATGRPARNKVVSNGFNAASMQKLLNSVAAYGAPIIYCSPEFAAEMANVIVYASTTPSATGMKISDQDVMDVRERGFIGKFHGAPVVVMPQSYSEEGELLINPSFAYVIPAGKEKVIKLAFEGNSYFREWDDHEGDNSIVLQAYAKVGAAVVSAPNYWGLYYNSALNEGAWTAYNTTLNA